MAKENEQSKELATKLWAIADDLRSNMDATMFKNYILGVIFYRYLSERTERYMDDLLKNDGISYEKAMASQAYEKTVRKWSIEQLGYVIEPKYLFKNLVAEIPEKKFSVEHLEKAVKSLTASTVGQESEPAFSGLFDAMDLQSTALGKEVSDRTDRMAKVMSRISTIDFDIDDADILGNAYMILIGLFQSAAGKKGGEFFTAAGPATCLARIAAHGLKSVKSACDPCAGSGSLLLRVQAELSDHEVGHFYADELEPVTYNLLRMNMLMHGVPYRKFSTYNMDSIEGKIDGHEVFDGKLFTIQVANPPYSHKYSADASLLDDTRFSSAGVLPPKGYEDMMFLESMVAHMADDGRVAALFPHGILFRGGAEGQIRKYLIDNLNVIDAVIGLPANLFHGTTIPVCIVVCKKDRNGDSGNILFIDASKHFKKGKSQNELEDSDIDRIVNAYVERKDIEKFAHVAKISEIVKNEYNLNISRYVDISEEEEELDPNELAATLLQDKNDIQEAKDKLKPMIAELGLKWPF